MEDVNGNPVKMKLTHETMFLDAKAIDSSGQYRCFIPIMGQKKGSDNMWFVGRQMLANYYTIFDATPLDSGASKLRVGVAPVNPNDSIGADLLEKHRLAQ